MRVDAWGCPSKKKKVLENEILIDNPVILMCVLVHKFESPWPVQLPGCDSLTETTRALAH